MDEDGMTYEDAVDFIEYNTVRACAYIENAPIILSRIDDYIDYADAYRGAE